MCLSIKDMQQRDNVLYDMDSSYISRTMSYNLIRFFILLIQSNLLRVPYGGGKLPLSSLIYYTGYESDMYYCI